jgi:hypothetical protein
MTTLPSKTFNGLKSILFIDIGYNYLESLEDGTFDNCPTLKNLYIDGNRIKMMKGDIFRPLINLKIFYVELNVCISSNYMNKDVELAYDAINLACWETPRMIQACQEDLSKAKSESESMTISLKKSANQCAKMNVKD